MAAIPMATYLLVWNPKLWHWADLPDVVNRVGRGEPVVERWSCGSNKRIVRGDRVFLIRLGREPKGIIGSGTVVVEPFEDVHWQPEKAQLGQKARYIEFQFDALLDPEREPILWRERLKSEAPLSRMHWDTRSSGVRIPDNIASELEKVWLDLVGPVGG
jgi:5-methylcytosine-specific restriction protein A